MKIITMTARAVKYATIAIRVTNALNVATAGDLRNQEIARPAATSIDAKTASFVLTVIFPRTAQNAANVTDATNASIASTATTVRIV
jgi:hypothetical protein